MFFCVKNIKTSDDNILQTNLTRYVSMYTKDSTQDLGYQ